MFNRIKNRRVRLLQLILTRGVRTRVPIKPLRKKEEPFSTPTMGQPEQAGPNDKPENKDPRYTLSKFSKDNTDFVSRIISKMKFKTPDQIKAELSARFEKDGIEVDEEFIDQMITQSTREECSVREYISNPKKAMDKINEEEINSYVDWIINDGFERLQTQKRDLHKRKMELREKLNDFMMNENTNTGDPKALTNAFQMAQEMTMLNSDSSLDKLPILLKHLTKLSNADLQKSVELGKYAALYEISTQLLEDHNRDMCIYLCGKLLYSALGREYGPRARPDAINEKFFIESCMKFDDNDRALELFLSRRDKDVKNERFWVELGAHVYLSRYSKTGDTKELDSGIELINETRDRWEYTSNILLIDGLKRCCTKGNFEDAEWFWEEIEINIDRHGIVKQIEVPEAKLFDENERNKVFQYYNRVEPLSYDSLLECIFAFIGSMKIEKGIGILTTIATIDNEFTTYFLDKFALQFKYPGRELLLFELENNDKDFDHELRSYLIENISQLHKNRCSSVVEAKILADISIYLERLSLLKNKNLSKINDLQELVNSGEKFTSFDIKSLLKILLDHKSTTSFQIASRLIHLMSEYKLSKNNSGILPPASSHTYSEFFKVFLSHPAQRINELNQFLNMMAQFEIKLDQSLATKIIMSYHSKNLYTEALEFITKYVFSDNPIAVNNVRLGKPGSKNLYTWILLTYYKMILIGEKNSDLVTSRLESLHFFVREMMNRHVDDTYTFQETIGTLLAYGDYQGTICLVQWYGHILGKNKLSFDLMLAIKTKLELSIIKAEKYLLSENRNLHDSQKTRINNYRREFGIQSLHDDMKTKRDYTWQEVAIVLYQYADLFGYRSTYSKDDPFSMVLSDEQRNLNKDVFDQQLQSLQDFFGIPKWIP